MDPNKLKTNIFETIEVNIVITQFWGILWFYQYDNSTHVKKSFLEMYMEVHRSETTWWLDFL